MIPLTERLWPKVDKNGPNGCWIWLASLDTQGYGRIYMGNQSEGIRPVHRVIRELLVCPIPKGKQLDHICHHPACVNPEHLRLCSYTENTRNKIIYRNNQCGFKGVGKEKRVVTKDTYVARIRFNGKLKYLGSFDTPEEAHIAYCDAADKLFGVFSNHG